MANEIKFDWCFCGGKWMHKIPSVINSRWAERGKFIAWVFVNVTSLVWHDSRVYLYDVCGCVSKGIWWQMTTKHNWQILPCVSSVAFKILHLIFQWTLKFDQVPVAWMTIGSGSLRQTGSLEPCWVCEGIIIQAEAASLNTPTSSWSAVYGYCSMDVVG